MHINIVTCMCAGSHHTCITTYIYMYIYVYLYTRVFICRERGRNKEMEIIEKEIDRGNHRDRAQPESLCSQDNHIRTCLVV